MVEEMRRGWGYGGGKVVWLEIVYDTLDKSLLRYIFDKSSDLLIIMPI